MDNLIKVIIVLIEIISQFLSALVSLIPDLIKMYLSISKIVNITSPLGIILLDIGVPIAFLGIAIFGLKLLYKKLIKI